MSRTVRALVACGLLLGATLSATASPATAQGETVQETGVVKHISDGDTVSVDVDGDGTTSLVRVRFASIQATEDYHPGTPGSYTRCHSQEAKDALSRMLLGKKVQLRSINKASTATDGVRLLRTVWVQQDGVWVDAGRKQLEQGHAFWYASQEYAHNYEYHVVSRRAQAVKRNIWNPDHCGVGPSAGIPVGMSLVWDATGDDRLNVNGEYVRVKNRSTTQGWDLSGWKVRDNTIHHEFTFPRGTYLKPGASATLHVGKGTSTGTTFYWGNDGPLFTNSLANGYGEGVYLLDPEDDFRAWFEYPCVLDCADPNAGKLRISGVQYDAPGVDGDNPNGEWVRITNSGTASIDLRPYRVYHAPYYYTFPSGSYLRPGETFTLHSGRGTSSRLTGYWGFDGSIYNNGGERVELVNALGTRLACSAWGTATC